MRVLLVEDNDNNRYLASFLLRRDGMVVIETGDGGRALALAVAEQPDAVLLDIQMPEIDGYEIAARLRGDPRTRTIPLVGVSSFAMPGDRERAFSVGFAGYIEKPLDPETFAAEVRRLIAGAVRP